VEITTDEGVEGYAEAPPRPTIHGESIALITSAIAGWFAPAIIGMDPFAKIIGR